MTFNIFLFTTSIIPIITFKGIAENTEAWRPFCGAHGGPALSPSRVHILIINLFLRFIEHYTFIYLYLLKKISETFDISNFYEFCKIRYKNMQELDIWSLRREYPVPLNIGQNQKLNNLFCNFHLFHSLPCKLYQ